MLRSVDRPISEQHPEAHKLTTTDRTLQINTITVIVMLSMYVSLPPPNQAHSLTVQQPSKPHDQPVTVVYKRPTGPESPSLSIPKQFHALIFVEKLPHPTTPPAQRSPQPGHPSTTASSPTSPPTRRWIHRVGWRGRSRGPRGGRRLILCGWFGRGFRGWWVVGL